MCVYIYRQIHRHQECRLRGCSGSAAKGGEGGSFLLPGCGSSPDAMQLEEDHKCSACIHQVCVNVCMYVCMYLYENLCMWESMYVCMYGCQCGKDILWWDKVAQFTAPKHMYMRTSIWFARDVSVYLYACMKGFYVCVSYVCMYLRTVVCFVYMSMCTCVYTYMYACLCVCVYVCMITANVVCICECMHACV